MQALCHVRWQKIAHEHTHTHTMPNLSLQFKEKWISTDINQFPNLLQIRNLRPNAV